MRDYLYAMLIPSGNEAANIVANNLGPGIPAFVEKMNAKAQELGMKNTHYANPHGLFDEQQYTTAEDIAILAQYAMKIDTFREAVSQNPVHASCNRLCGRTPADYHKHDDGAWNRLLQGLYFRY